MIKIIKYYNNTETFLLNLIVHKDFLLISIVKNVFYETLRILEVFHNLPLIIILISIHALNAYCELTNNHFILKVKPAMETSLK